MTPEAYQGGLGNTALHTELTVTQGLGVEFFLGFVLVLVVFGVCDPNKTDVKAPAAMAIGLTVVLGHLAAVSIYTCSLFYTHTQNFIHHFYILSSFKIKNVFEPNLAKL